AGRWTRKCRAPGGAHSPRPDQAGRRDALGPLRDLVPGVVRSGRSGGPAHALLGPLCPPRRPRETDAGQPARPRPRGVLDGQPRSARVRVQAARGSQVPQRRSLHRRRREVQLPSGQGLEGPPRQGPGRGGRAPPPTGWSSGSHGPRGGKALHDKARDVVVASPSRVRFVLHEPWPDFMTYYGSIVSGAGWVGTKKYVERVGDDGFKRAPVGLGPYKFVSHTPGVELVMEANEGYWRKVPSVKRLVFKSVPESTTRLAMLKRGEVDIAYLLDVPQAQEVKRDPNLRLAFSGGIAIWYLDFLEQWDPKSPWND